MRKATAAMLAVPILAFVSVAALLRRSAIARGTLAVGLALSLGLGAVAIGRPAATVATPPTAIVPLSEADFTTAVATNQGATEAVSIDSAPRWTTGPWRPRSGSSRPRPQRSAGMPAARC